MGTIWSHTEFYPTLHEWRQNVIQGNIFNLYNNLFGISPAFFCFLLEKQFKLISTGNES